MILPIHEPPRVRLWRLWQDAWPAGVVLLVALAIVALAAVCCAGCSGADATRAALASMTNAVRAANPALLAKRKADGDACRTESGYERAKSCVDAVRSKWAPVWAAERTLQAVDQSALDGEPDVAAAVSAYCTIAAAWPALPPLPQELGACQR